MIGIGVDVIMHKNTCNVNVYELGCKVTTRLLFHHAVAEMSIAEAAAASCSYILIFDELFWMMMI